MTERRRRLIEDWELVGEDHDDRACPYGHIDCRTDRGYCLDEVVTMLDTLDERHTEAIERNDATRAKHTLRSWRVWWQRLSPREQEYHGGSNDAEA